MNVKLKVMVYPAPEKFITFIKFIKFITFTIFVLCTHAAPLTARFSRGTESAGTPSSYRSSETTSARYPP